MDTVPEPARTEEWAAAFRLIFQYLPAQESERLCANALHMLQRGELNPQGLFLVRGPAGPRGALYCLPVPGRSALLWPPGAVEDRRAELEDSLLRHACGWLRQRGVKLTQTLLAQKETFLAAPLLRNGFTAVTLLWYMRHDLSLPVHCLNTPARLDYQCFDDDMLFRLTLRRTYEATLDCPEVNGVRSIEEVLEGHRAQGVFDPGRWWLVRSRDRRDAGPTEPVGVLMMTEMPESGDWEVSYMGVVPDARRRGFGREMLLHALCEARAADVPTVTLSVDARNQPAWQLYRSVGFEPYDQRIVYLAIFN
ncbi:MAG TPA: N-acetyltransferase [Gemmataceae bacterium]|nr:N-acetyltransferase [Gemmataceae bacterium]